MQIAQTLMVAVSVPEENISTAGNVKVSFLQHVYEAENVPICKQINNTKL